ncbi:MAG: thiamine pyrophosphate-dependent enzyme [Caulobacterales bacterium]
MATPTKLHLHIPQSAARPGDPVSFQHFQIPPAGTVRLPPIDVVEPDVRDLPYTMIRTLDEDGQAVGKWDPKLSADVLMKGLRAMMVTRAFDDRMFRAHRQGKTSFYMKSTGEEAISVAQAMALRAGDMCFPTYRVQGWLVARGYPLLNLANQIFSNAEDPLAGRQMPVMYSARDYGFYSISGNLGSRMGHAVGWGMASAYRGDDNIALGYIGEGSTAEGAFHEALTFATVYRAPVIVCVTNNQWAISSYSGIAGAESTTFAARAIGYGLPGLRVDGNDFLAVWAATEWAAERARTNHGPTLIEFFTYRGAGHSTSDDPSKYRPADEPQKWPLGDPVDRLRDHLIVLGEWDETRHEKLKQEVFAEVRDIVKQAEAVGTLGQSKPPLELMFEDVFKEPDWRIIEQRKELGL